MIVADLKRAIEAAPDDAEVMFDVEAKAFDYHMEDITAAYCQDYPLEPGKKWVTLHSNGGTHHWQPKIDVAKLQPFSEWIAGFESRYTEKELFLMKWIWEITQARTARHDKTT